MPAAARLPGDRRGAGVALQRLWIIKHRAVRTDLRQQAWGELFSCAGQGAEQVVVRVSGEQLVDPGAVLIELRLQRAKLLGAGDGTQALGRRDGGVGAGGLGGSFEKFHAFGRGLWAIELVGVKEFFPLVFAGAGQVMRRREREDELPRPAQSPIAVSYTHLR